VETGFNNCLQISIGHIALEYRIAAFNVVSTSFDLVCNDNLSPTPCYFNVFTVKPTTYLCFSVCGVVF